MIPDHPIHRAGPKKRRMGVFLICMGLMAVTGCTLPIGAPPKHGDVMDMTPPGSIISTGTMSPISFDALIDDLADIPLIFIGEQHTNPAHHDIQLRVMQALYDRNPNLQIGMEMFDRSYQQTLARWSSGLLDRQTFLRQVHWYANWKFDYALYEPLLEFIQSSGIRLFGVNIPFHIPAKIAVGGIESLAEEDRKHLPKDIDLSNEAHREYVHRVYTLHRVPGRDHFDFFYQAQCVWEEVMAETIADHLDSRQTLVLAGNGHIIYGFGIPDRVVRRVPVPYRTIYPAPHGTPIENSFADYIWVTPAVSHGRRD